MLFETAYNINKNVFHAAYQILLFPDIPLCIATPVLAKLSTAKLM